MKKWLVRVLYHTRDDDLVLVVKTNNIEKYMDDFIKDKLDQIYSYEYIELNRIKIEANKEN